MSPAAGVSPLPGTFDITINRRRATCAPCDPPSEAHCPRCATFKARQWCFHALERGARSTSRKLCIDCGITDLFTAAKKDGVW